MSRDYKSKSMATTRSGGPLFLGLFIGYALGIVSAIGVWIYINQAPSPFLTEDKTVKQKPAGNVSSKTEGDKVNNKELDQANVNRPRFDFYNILPSSDEPLTEEPFDQAALSSTPIKNDTSVTSDYFLQIGSYKNANEAERMKAELALLGIMASVQTAESSDKGTWYRVRVGPYSKIDEIDQMRASLQENGIETNYVRVPRNSP